MQNLKKILVGVGVVAILSAGIAEASHFRGAAMIPVVDANGLLTVTTTSFWRPTFVADMSPTVTGFGNMIQQSNVLDTSDIRFTKRTQVFTFQLSGAGTYGITDSSCCRVAGIINALEATWTMDSTLVWDGQNANAPILFDFGAIQPEVVRGINYSDSLGALSGSGWTLSYDQALNQNIISQPPGFVVDPSTGALTISGANTASYLDNPTANIGADYAFSGNIFASDGSSVEFDWLFDAVNSGTGNQAPNVDDAVINALVGDVVTHTVTGLDPNGDPLTWDLLSFFGPGGALTPLFDPVTQLLTWNTSGLSVGDTLIANVRASDGTLTDVGTITINMVSPINGNNGTAPEPGTLLLMGAGLAGLVARRKLKK